MNRMKNITLQAAALTLQWKREALVRNQEGLQQRDQLLQHETVDWTVWRDDLQAELTVLFGCATIYDLGARTCPAIVEEGVQ